MNLHENILPIETVMCACVCVLACSCLFHHLCIFRLEVHVDVNFSIFFFLRLSFYLIRPQQCFYMCSFIVQD